MTQPNQPNTTSRDKRNAALNNALAQLEREFGKGTVMKMNAEGLKDIEAISTGSLRLDLALGIGGIPKGRIIEIFGPESSGKTTILYHIIANVQKEGGVAAFIDAEHAMDPIYARNLGVNIDELLVSQPDYGEQALEIANRLIQSGGVDFVAVDSVAALTPRVELEGKIGDQTVGVQARMMGQAMRMLAGACNRNGTTLMFTNQIREKVGVMFGSPETTPGGRALKFYASQRLKINRTGSVKGRLEDGTEGNIANTTKVQVVKNKVAPPFRVAEFDIAFGTGISSGGEILDEAVKAGIITKSGAFFSYGDTRVGQGRPNAVKFLEDPENKVAHEIEEKVRNHLGIGDPNAVAPVEPVVVDPEQEEDPAAE